MLQKQKIENVMIQKFLDVYIDNNLSWNYQIEALNSKLALLRRISYYLTDEMKQLFYNAYIMSNFDAVLFEAKEI
jgi:hypothetical protein